MKNKTLKLLKGYLHVVILFIIGLSLLAVNINNDIFIIEIISYCIIRLLGIFFVFVSINNLPFLKEPVFEINISYSNKKEEK